ncbi:MAG: ion channel [Desulfobacterales bacterium]
MHMNESARIDDVRPWYKSRFVYLIVAIISMIAVTPFLQGYVAIRILMDIFFSAIFLAAIFSISDRKRLRAFGAILALPTIVSLWTTYFMVNDAVFMVGRIFGILFFGFAIVQILQFIFRAKDVTKDVIFAAIVVYLLMPMMWSFIYGLLEVLQPGSFNIPAAHIHESRRLFMYFSFVTITTLGYGDITPLAERATSFAILEAVIGQIYLVVVVAWLVGMHVSRKSK